MRFPALIFSFLLVSCSNPLSDSVDQAKFEKLYRSGKEIRLVDYSIHPDKAQPLADALSVEADMAKLKAKSGSEMNMTDLYRQAALHFRFAIKRLSAEKAGMASDLRGLDSAHQEWITGTDLLATAEELYEKE